MLQNMRSGFDILLAKWFQGWLYVVKLDVATVQMSLSAWI